MAVVEGHFVGFDPTQGPPPEAGCPANRTGATIIYYEQWFHTAWSFKIIRDTGIVYNWGYGTFDMLGNLISLDDIYGLGSEGFAGNETCYGQQKCPSPDEWLARARTATHAESAPRPGTILMAPPMRATLGRRG